MYLCCYLKQEVDNSKASTHKSGSPLSGKIHLNVVNPIIDLILRFYQTTEGQIIKFNHHVNLD